MARFLLTMNLCFIINFVLFGRPATPQKVFTKDIDNFWIAFDSIQTTQDSAKRLHFIQTLYIDKGTPGLKAFMRARDYTAAGWVKLISQYPKFWQSVRPNTLLVNNKEKEIEQSLRRFKMLYPELKNAKMYFTIGGLTSGGTTTDSLVLIGSEIATGNPSTDVSEFPTKWLAGVFKEQTLDNVVNLNIHEYVHTQQNGEAGNLLAQAITEGSCDFITELVIGKPLLTNYIKFGLAHEKELKDTFKQEMFSNSFKKWLYNGSKTKTAADLGYFMGYKICKSYYANALDKNKAIKEIIELNYSDTIAVENILSKSKYFTEPVDKQQLVKTFEAKQPVLLNIIPISNNDTLVDVSIKEITLAFSKPMGKGYSINWGERGKAFSPIIGVAGFSTDNTSFNVKVDLKPNHEYEFIITNRSFASFDDYPLLKNYAIKFKTKP